MPQSPFYGISQLPKRLPVLYRQFHNKCTSIPSPFVTCEAAGQLITVMINLYERRAAAVTATEHGSSSNTIRL